MRGVNVFRGYCGNDAGHRRGDRATAGSTPATSASSTTTGYLRITGRKKEILVTAGGKNVAPAVLEDRLRAHPLVSQCIVVGDGKPFIAALVTLDEDMYPAWSANHGLDGVAVRPAARTDARVIAEVQTAVDDANTAVSKAESIRKFAILDARLHRGDRPPHAVPEAQAQRRDA